MMLTALKVRSDDYDDDDENDNDVFNIDVVDDTLDHRVMLMVMLMITIL